MSFLRLENISKSFGSFQALKNISFQAEAGAFVVLLGPSGCGKSTLLRLITGLTEDHEGEIYIDDRRVTDLDPKDRRVAMVFQSYALYPHLNVRKNISFGMEINRVPKPERERRVLEAAKALGLDTMLNRLPAQLSGGQRQRVAIGRCLVREPDVFLFDEPLSNLDTKLRNETRIELKRLHQRLKATTIYVTHDQHEAMTLASIVVLMKDGEIVQIATPEDLYTRPSNRFAATFIGSPSINLIRGELSSDGRFRGGGLHLSIPDGPRGQMSRSVELGLRPESARIVNVGEEAHHAVAVEYVEGTGADLYVNGTSEGQNMVLRIDRTIKAMAGDVLPIRWEISQALIFDEATGDRIWPRSPCSPTTAS